MPKLHKLPDSQVDGVVLAAIIDEHRQTRHPVRTRLVCIAANAADATDQQAVMWSLTRLKRAGKLERKDPASGWLPVAGIARPVPEQAAKPEPEAEAAPKAPDPVRGDRGDQPASPHHHRVQAGPEGSNAQGLAHAAEDRPGTAWARQSLPVTAADVSPDLRKKQAEADLAELNLQKAFKGASGGIDADLLDRCAAMNMTLIEQARDAYAQGVPSAGRELLWLMETGRQLSEAGGAA